MRPIAEDILAQPDHVLAQVKAALAEPAPRAAVRNSFDPALVVPEHL